MLSILVLDKLANTKIGSRLINLYLLKTLLWVTLSLNSISKMYVPEDSDEMVKDSPLDFINKVPCVEYTLISSNCFGVFIKTLPFVGLG